MADYKRFVSYMYEYENGEKKKNVGFSRVELRKGHVDLQYICGWKGFWTEYFLHI